jgi:hypothetical protein
MEVIGSYLRERLAATDDQGTAGSASALFEPLNCRGSPGVRLWT